MTGDMSSWRNAPKTRRANWTRVSAGVCSGRRDDGPRVHVSLITMTEVARAAEAAGSTADVLRRSGAGDDPWIGRAGDGARDDDVRFMIAFQPGFLDPVQNRAMSATLPKRLLARTSRLNIITGGGGPQQHWLG